MTPKPQTKEDVEMMNRIRLWAGSHPSCSINQVAAYFGCSPVVVQTALSGGRAQG